jgi:hypothetical protein
MNAQELKDRILREIGTRTTTRSGWDFIPHLLPLPELRSYKVPPSNDDAKLWTILVMKNKYGVENQVVYDEKEDCFGVAVGRIHVGLYGTLMKTIDSLQ